MCSELEPRPLCDLGKRWWSSVCPLTLEAAPITAVPGAPELGAPWRMNSCALVSSSGVLRGSGCGAAVDRHDAVFRFNLPRLDGFEADVGRRTTLMLVNEAVVRQLFARSSKPPSHDARGADVLYAKSLSGPLARQFPELASTGGVARRRGIARQIGGRSFLTAADTPLPSLGEYPAASWFASLHLGGQPPSQSRHHYLSTGMRGLLLAAATCRSITPFGFTGVRNEPANRSFHYWEAPRSHSLVHGAENMSFEHLVVRALRAGPLHVCLRENRTREQLV